MSQHIMCSGRIERLEPPLQRLLIWREEAVRAGSSRASTMILATTSRDGTPSVRTVSCRGISCGGVRFFTNRRSRKAREMAENPRAALLFDWSEVRKQARVEGGVEVLPRAEVEAYFASRPRGHQLAAWVSSHQSEIMSEGADLMALREALAERYAGEGIPCPDWFEGYCLLPRRIELWTGGSERLHRRELYVRVAQGWQKAELFP